VVVDYSKSYCTADVVGEKLMILKRESRTEVEM